MLIHLTTPLEMAHNEIEVLRKIIAVIHNRGHSLTKDWVEAQFFRYSQLEPKPAELEWEVICRQQPHLIESADIVIAEASGYGTFGVGHQVAIAQMKDKPVLLLTKYLPPYGAYPKGLNFGKTIHQPYSNEDLIPLVLKFIKSYEQKD